MTTPSPASVPETCPFGCGAEPEPPEDQDFGPGGYGCGSAIVPGEPKEESGFQSSHCKVVCLTRERDALRQKLEAVAAILPSSACDLRKLQNIEGVLSGAFQPSYFNNPTHPGD